LWATLPAGYNPYFLNYIAGNHLNNSPSGYASLGSFNNFFHGQVQLPSQLYFPSVSLVSGYPGNITALHTALGAPNCGDTGCTPDGTQPVQYVPIDLNDIVEHTYSGYFAVQFADSSHLGVPMSGNVGVRVVSTTDHINGYVLLPSNAVILPGGTGTSSFPGGSFAEDVSTSDMHVLPSMNVQFQLAPQTHLRFALSKAINRPTFTQLSPNGQITANSDATQHFTGFTGNNTGDPNIVPETANQLDSSLEWYGNSGAEAHVAVFYKDIHNYILTGVHNATLNVEYPDGSVQPSTVVVTAPYNAATATVQGVEFGGQTYFNSLPSFLKGFGINSNFTYLDSSSPDAVAYDMDGRRIHNLPLEGLSKYTFNLIGLYDRGSFSARLAYNWRSQYLLTTTNNGTSGTASYNGTTLTYALPVFNQPYGQLDASASYKFAQHFVFAVEASNLTDALTRTVMGVDEQQHGRNWFMTDRRYSASLRVDF